MLQNSFFYHNKVIDDMKYNIMDGNIRPCLILLFTVFCQVSCYERCTYGYILYYYCDTGSCCKIGSQWYCTGIHVSPSDCDSFRETTTKEPTTRKSDTRVSTKAPRIINDVKNPNVARTMAAIGGAMVLVFFLGILSCCIYRKRGNNNGPPNSLPNTTGSQSTGNTPQIYYVPGTTAGVNIQPKQTPYRGRILSRHGQQIPLGNHGISNMHHNKPVDHQHQHANSPPPYEEALHTSEPAGERGRL